MLLRRVYSSVPPARAALSNVNGAGASISSPIASGTASRTSTRGRFRPRLTGKAPRSIVTASQRTAEAVTASSSRVNQGKGRRKPSRLATASSPSLESVEPADLDFLRGESAALSESHTGQSNATPRLTFTHPVPALNHTNDFQPIYLYPEQFKLHTTFTHPHLPLPLYLGTNIYTSPRKSSSPSTPITEDFFAPPSPPDPAARLRRARPSKTGMSEHSSVVSALSHPSLLHHLGDKLPWGMPSPEMEFGGLGAVLESTAVKLNPAQSDEWSATLDWLDGKKRKSDTSEAGLEATVPMEGDSAVDSAVADLTAVLSQLGMSSTRGRRSPIVHGARSGLAVSEAEVDMSGEEGVRMDSVKRKRKKKISKHKYKKRRKATRALRKRLGK